MRTNNIFSITETTITAMNLETLRSYYRNTYGDDLPIGMVDVTEISDSILDNSEIVTMCMNINGVHRSLESRRDGSNIRDIKFALIFTLIVIVVGRLIVGL